MTRRQLIPISLAAVLAPVRAILAEAVTSIRGRLAAGAQPAINVDGRRIALAGDEDTMHVIADERLNQTDFEITGHYENGGHYENAGRFIADPIGSHALFVHKNGKRWYVTYWCDNCSVRYLIPGPCVCCGKITALDLRDKPE